MALRSQWHNDKTEVVAEHGVVTAMEPPSAEAGLAMLRAGGNAVDAAVAMGFCNVVLEPYMATIGGMGYMVVHMVEQGLTVGVDFNGRAPRRATPDMYEVLGPAPAGGIAVYTVAGRENEDGPRSVTVPGTCAGLCAVHERFGTLPLAQVLEPAIGLAADGFESNWYTTLFMANHFDTVRADPYLAAMWLPEGRPPRSNPPPIDRIVQRDLADLLRRIAREGAAGMYRGEVADAIHDWLRDQGGILTRDDLAEYAPVFAEPLRGRFAGHEIACVATPSGAITNLEIFGILEHQPLAGLDHNSAPYLHLLIEAARHAFADRYRYLGDWEHAPVPLHGLLSPDYHATIARRIAPGRASLTIKGREEPWSYYREREIHDPDPWAFDGGTPPAEPARAIAPARKESTTHLNVVDRHRNAVSCTHTGAWSSVHPPGTGVYLTHGMAWFTPVPGHANSIAGWKRPMNNMCPVMVFRDGRPVICQGAPGARRIMHRGVQVLLNLILHRMGPQAAIVAFTLDSSGRETLVDSRLPGEVVEELRRYSHEVRSIVEEPGMGGTFSRPSAITIDWERGLLRAGVDAFRPAIALGY